MSQNKSPSVRLFIGGLPYRFTEGELLLLFAPFGRIIFLKIMHTPWGKSRGIGFVEFDLLESAINAKTKLHNHRLGEDRTIIVDYADPDPMTTAEGQQRHAEAVTRNPKKFKSFAADPSPHGQNRHSPKNISYERKKLTQRSNYKVSSRQSVYDSRHHHARVGAKFAKRNKG